MHSGIHAGTALIAAGDIEKGVFDLVGDVPNVAARLSQKRRPGRFSPAPTRSVPTPISSSWARPPGLPAAGLDLPAHAVLGRGAATNRFESTSSRGLTPVYRPRRNRSGAARLRARRGSRAARDGIILGGAGLGKTRLMEEVLQSIDPAAVTVLRGGCENYLGAEIFSPSCRCCEPTSACATASCRKRRSRSRARRWSHGARNSARASIPCAASWSPVPTSGRPKLRRARSTT